MTAATIAVAIIAATAGTVAGYTIKHMQDTRWIRKICDAYEELIDQTAKVHRKETERLMAYINRQQQREILQKINNKPLMTAVERTNRRTAEALGLGFPDINEPLPDLPEDWQEIDFGGNF